MMIKKTDQTYYYNALTGARVAPYDWQMKIKKGDYYEIESASFAYPDIYGVILETMEKKGYFRVQAYSAWCIGGQKGVLCVVEPTRLLTLQEFEKARDLRWKVVEENVEADAQ